MHKVTGSLSANVDIELARPVGPTVTISKGRVVLFRPKKSYANNYFKIIAKGKPSIVEYFFFDSKDNDSIRVAYADACAVFGARLSVFERLGSKGPWSNVTEIGDIV